MVNEKKPILAVETSEKNCGVCLYFNSEKYFETLDVLNNNFYISSLKGFHLFFLFIISIKMSSLRDYKFKSR